MTAGELHNDGLSSELPLSRMDLLTDELPRQGLIDALVDLDQEYDREREIIRRSSLGAALKAWLLTKLKDRYRIRCHPYMQQLAALSELT